MPHKRCPMSNQSLPKHLRLKALRATHAVALGGALMLAGCPDDQTSTDNNSGWNTKDQGSDQTDMATDLGQDMTQKDQGSDQSTTDMSTKDMTQTDQGTVDQGNDQGTMDQGSDQSTMDMSTDQGQDMIKDMPGPKCDGTPDRDCPNNCTADNDADCCIAKSDRQQTCAFDTANNKCECKPIVMCNDISDGICPAQCTELNDADCCTQKAPDANSACTYQPGKCECKVGCDITATDNVCPAECTQLKDADCCIKDPLCNYDKNAQQCFCAVPGPFRPPAMPAR